MMRVVCIRWMIDRIDTVSGDQGAGLCGEGIDTTHVEHMFGIVMYIITDDVIIAHTIHGPGPPPSYTNSGIRHFAHLVVFDMNVVDIAAADAYAAPIFVSAVD